MSIINDYELIYLVQSENDGIAFAWLIEKYERLIYKMIYQFHVSYDEVDDYFQEGLMFFHKAVLSFNECYDKTFMRYFELIFKRHLIKLTQKPKLVLFEDTSFIIDTRNSMDDLSYYDIMFEHPIEQSVYHLYFLEHMTLDYICKKENFTKKQIYNAIHRIKEKLKTML